MRFVENPFSDTGLVIATRNFDTTTTQFIPVAKLPTPTSKDYTWIMQCVLVTVILSLDDVIDNKENFGVTQSHDLLIVDFALSPEATTFRPFNYYKQKMMAAIKRLVDVEESTIEEVYNKVAPKMFADVQNIVARPVTTKEIPGFERSKVELYIKRTIATLELFKFYKTTIV